MKRSILTLLVTFSSLYSFGEDLHQKIKNLYGGFIPHEVSNEVYDKKMKELESFWKEFKSDTLKNLPALRQELLREDNPSYFYWDGMVLLSASSRSKRNNESISHALTKIDTRDVYIADTDQYWHFLRYLVTEDFDTSDLALKILEVKGFNAAIYEHGFRIDKNYCLYYLLIPLSPIKYVNKLIEKYKTEKIEDNKEIIIKMLWHSRSCAANVFLKTLLQSESSNKNISDKLRKLNIYSISSEVPDEKYTKTIDRQKEVYTFITDYTIKEIDRLTKKLRKYNCL